MIDVFYQKNERIPIWFMRQAGRYLPEYLEVRNSLGGILDLCYNPDKASEVTLQPIKRFDLDFAIIFSDILVLPHALGWQVNFEKGEGPVLQQFKSEEDFAYLKNNPGGKLQKVYEAIDKTKARLPKGVSLIGFAGAPWTIMSYMLEGRGKQDFSTSKRFIYENFELAKKLVYLLADNIILHLSNQLKSGADLVQLFDTWSGMLEGEEYQKLVIEPTNYIVSNLRKEHADAKIIGFPKGSAFLYEDYIRGTGVDALGVDQFIPIEKMAEWQKRIVVQGNIDPITLLADKETVKKKAEIILSNLDSKNFIFNLGHGILPATKIENVEFLIDYVRNYKR